MSCLFYQRRKVRPLFLLYASISCNLCVRGVYLFKVKVMCVSATDRTVSAVYSMFFTISRKNSVDLCAKVEQDESMTSEGTSEL